MARKLFLNAAIAAALLSGCSHGAGVLPVAGHTAPDHKSASATFVLRIPPRSGVSPSYVSPATQSLVVKVTSVNGVALTPAFPPVALNVTPGSAQCPYPASGQPQTCTFTVSLPVGTDAMTITAYDKTQSNAALPVGNALSAATVTQAVTGNDDTIKMTLDAVPVSAKIALSGSTISIGTASTLTLTATAYDAQSNVIVGPGNYTTPIALTLNDATGRLSLSASSFTAPGQSITVKYSGGLGLTPATIAASLNGTAANTVTVNFLPGLINSTTIPASPAISPQNGGIAITPDGSELVIDAGSAGTYQQNNSSSNMAAFFSTATLQETAVIPFGVIASGAYQGISGPLAFSNDGTKAFLPWIAGYSNAFGGIAEFSLANHSLVTDAINGNTTSGPTYYQVVSRKGSSNLYALATSQAGVQVISSVDGSTIANISGPGCESVNGATCLAFSPDGSTLYATQYAGYHGGSAIDVIDAATNTVRQSISSAAGWPFSLSPFLAYGPTSIALAPGGSKLYVMDYNNPASSIGGGDDPNVQDLSTIDTASLAYTYQTGYAGSGSWLSVSPDGANLFQASNGNTLIYDAASGALLGTLTGIGTSQWGGSVNNAPVFIPGTHKFFEYYCSPWGSNYNGGICQLAEYQY